MSIRRDFLRRCAGGIVSATTGGHETAMRVV